MSRTRADSSESVALVRYCQFSQVATLTPATAELVVSERRRNRDGPPWWLPEVLVYGFFDILGDVTVSLYRSPADLELLWLQLGSERFLLDHTVSSTFTPTLDNAEPPLAYADVRRRFELLRSGAVEVTHRYVLDDRDRRLARGIDPFPSWPEEEEGYDLLFLVHRAASSRTCSRLIPKPRLV